MGNREVAVTGNGVMEMAKQNTPHTQTQQDTHPAQTDVNRDELQQDSGSAPEYNDMEGAQTGGTRSSKTMPGSAHEHNTEEQRAAFVGTLASRSFEDDSKQGVTTNPSSKEAAGQRKVVGEREDGQVGVNHSDKISPR